MTDLKFDALGNEIKIGDYFVYGIVRSGSLSYGVGRVVTTEPLAAITTTRWCREWQTHKNGRPIRRSPAHMIVIPASRVPDGALEVIG